MKKSKTVFDEELLMKKFKDYEANPTIKLRNEIIEMNVPLVEYVVNKYFNDIGVDKDELVSIGYFGLIQAVEAYDVDYGTSFSTYAVTCIINKIKKNLSTVTDIKMIRYNYSILVAKNIIEKNTGISLDSNIAELDGILEEDTYVNENLKKKLRTYLLTRNCTYNEQNVAETYEMEDSIYDKMLIEKIKECLSTLSEKERKVLEFKYGYYGICPTEEDLGNFLGCTHQNVNSIRKKALHKLRTKMNCKI